MSRLSGPAIGQSAHPHDQRAAPDAHAQSRYPLPPAQQHFGSVGDQQRTTGATTGFDQAGGYGQHMQPGSLPHRYPQAGTDLGHPQHFAPAPPAGNFHAPPQGYAPAANGYAPQFDRYVPQPAPPQQTAPSMAQKRPESLMPQEFRSGPGFDGGRGAPAAPGFGYAPAARDPLTELRSTTHDHYRTAPDPRGYDLGNYMPSQVQPPQQAYAPQSEPQSLDQWSGHDAYANNSLDPRAAHREYQDQAGARGELMQPADHGGEADDGEFEYEEPPRRRRGLLIVSALIGTIALGSAMAYGYKTFFGGPKRGSAPPVVRNDAAPAKMKPADSGGRQFANQDSKLLGKLGDQPPAAQPAAALAAAGDTDASGVRKVATLAVGRDGSIAAPAAAPAVPGMILDNGFKAQPSPPPAAAPVAAPPAAPPRAVVAAAPPPPQAPVARVPVAAAPPAAAPQPAAEAPAPAAKAPTKKPKPRDDLAAAGGAAATAPVAAAAAPAAAAPATKGGITGYMAVLASTKSRMDALKTFADLQQKYPDVLGARSPEVQESDQSARGLGIIYRVMVGQPGSRESASAICSQLKAAGHGGCWVTSF